MYGLNDAAKKWCFAVYEELEKLGCHRSSMDYFVFFWYHDNHLSGLFQSHVDDFLWARIKEFKEAVLFPLCYKFKVSRKSIKQFKYVAINISQQNEEIKLDQLDYISSINPIQLPRACQANKNDSGIDSESTQYQQIVGKLNWVTNQT